MKKSKVVIPALGLIALSTAASITGTVAWFSANQSVSIKGMTVATRVSSNLLIAGEDTVISTTKKADSAFDAGPLEQSVKGILMPASTIDGVNFYYTLKAKADGDAKTEEYTKYGTEDALVGDDITTYNDPFSKAYGITKTGAPSILAGETGAKPYVDYVFQLKATNALDSVSKLALTKLDLVYGGASDPSRAYRVAFFLEDLTDVNAASGAVGTLGPIYTVSGAANFTSGEAVSGAAATAPVSYNSSATYLVNSIAAHTTKQYKVVVRLWLEGEDNTCNNSTFAALTSSWSLRLELKLDSGATPVTYMTKYTHALVSTTDWYYDGTYVWNNIENIGTATGRTAIAEASNEVKTAFGYVEP